MYGNTKKVAEAMAEAFGKSDTIKLLPIGDTKLWDVTPADLLIVGSPTQRGRPTAAL